MLARRLLLVSLFLLTFQVDADAGWLFRRRCRPYQPPITDAAPPPVSPLPDPPPIDDDQGIDVDDLVQRIVDILATDPRFDHDAPVSEERIAEMILIAIQTKPDPVSPQAVVHFAVIADESSEYWRHLAPVLNRAQQKYHRVSLSAPPPPTAPAIGPLPQVVEYRNSIPQRTFFSREVYDVLDRISRGTYPPGTTIK